MQGSRSSPCLGPHHPHLRGICFLGEFFIAKHNYGGNCSMAWHFLQNTSSFRGREKKDPFVKANQRAGEKVSYYLFPRETWNKQVTQVFFAQVSVEDCCSLQAPCLGLVSNLAKLFAWETYPVPMSGPVGKAAPLGGDGTAELAQGRRGKTGAGGPAAAPASASSNFPMREASPLSFKTKLPFP